MLYQQPQSGPAELDLSGAALGTISALLPIFKSNDLVRSAPVPAPSGVSAVAITPEKFAFTTTSSFFAYDDTVSAYFRLSTFTKVLKFRLNSTSNGYIYTSDGRFTIGVGVESIPSGEIGVSWYDGSFRTISIPATLGDHTIVVVATPSGVTLYLDGKMIGSTASGSIVYSGGRGTVYGYVTFFSLAGTIFDLHFSSYSTAAMPGALALRISANPWMLLLDPDEDDDLFLLASGAGPTDTPINPTTATGASKGGAPTLAQTANQSLSPSNARGARSSYAPVLLRTANQSLSPANASSASGAYAPTVTQAVTLTLTPGAATGAVQGYAPTISATANQYLVPASGTGAFSCYAPSILQPQALSPSNGTGAAAGYAPSVTQAITTTIQPFAGTLASNGYSLSITQSNNAQLQPSAGTGALVGAVPLLVQTTAKSLVPDAGSGAFKGHAPTITQFDPTTDVRYARPASDVSQGCWLPSVPASTLASMIDEVTPSSADYIYATAACTCEVKLNPVVDPQTSSGQVVRYQAWSPEGNGVTVTLKQGATAIASWAHPVLPLTATIYAQTLTSAQCDSITNYADLRFEFTAA